MFVCDWRRERGRNEEKSEGRKEGVRNGGGSERRKEGVRKDVLSGSN